MKLFQSVSFAVDTGLQEVIKTTFSNTSHGSHERNEIKNNNIGYYGISTFNFSSAPVVKSFLNK
jgi:hypothetical protein